MKKSILLMILSFISINFFGVSNGFSIFPSLKECLAEYKEAYKEFEPEAKYAKVELEIKYEQRRKVYVYHYITSGDLNKLNRYLRACDNLTEIVIRRIAIKSSLVGVFGTLAILIANNPILKQRLAAFIMGFLASLSVIIDENSVIKEKIPYYHYSLLLNYCGHSDLIKRDDLFSQTNLLPNIPKLLVSSMVIFLTSGITLIASKLLLGKN